MNRIPPLVFSSRRGSRYCTVSTSIPPPGVGHTANISCHGYPVMPIISWLSCRGCPVMAVLPRLSCHGFNVRALFSDFPVTDVLFGYPIAAVPAWLSSTTVLSRLSCRGCPGMSVLHDCHVTAVLSRLSCHGCD